ncbi:zinc-dependent alcohol dehydrogenase [Paenibacillus sp. strain BS8-2]
MRALVYEGPRVMNIRDTDIPELKENELLVRVAYAGICGSELGGYLGHNSLRKPPLIMGHEFTGVVERMGSAVNHWAQGDRVVVNPLVTCGQCVQCLSAREQLCEKRALLGAHRPGAFAEYVAVPASNVLRLPDSVSLEEGVLAEPLACAAHIGRLLQWQPQDRLLIYGAGPIGLFVLAAARIHGLKHIDIVDINADRLAIANALGGQGATTAEGDYDKAVDAVGATVTRKRCVEAVRAGGTVVFTGLHESDSEMPINDIIRREIVCMGAFAYAPQDFAVALEWLESGLLQMDQWTRILPLTEGASGFETLLGSPGGIAKILLKP